jgi:hypothetical protein
MSLTPAPSVLPMLHEKHGLRGFMTQHARRENRLQDLAKSIIRVFAQ